MDTETRNAIERATQRARKLLEDDFASQLPAAIDVVVHLAQSSQYRGFPDTAPDIFAVNTAATARLLDVAAERGGWAGNGSASS